MRRKATTLGLVIAAILLAASTSLAHAKLVSSTPLAGDVDDVTDIDLARVQRQSSIEDEFDRSHRSAGSLDHRREARRVRSREAHLRTVAGNPGRIV